MNRRLLAALLAASLLAAACGDDGEAGDVDTTGDASTTTTTVAPTDSDDTTTTSAAAPPKLTASWTGVTEDTIRVGFTMSDLERLSAGGIIDLDRGDPQVVVDALIADVNGRGGLNGRMLEGHLELVLPTESTEAEAACVRLTQDVQVFAVVGPFDGPNSEVNPCLNDLNETILVGGQPTADLLERSRAPWISDTMSSERRLAGVVALMEADDLFGDVVGVTYFPSEQTAADDIVIPALEDLGKTVTDAVVEVGDASTTEGVYAVIAERFRSAGVDSIVMLESSAATGATQFTLAGLDAQLLVVDSAFFVASIGAIGTVPTEDLEGVIGSSGASDQDAWELPATQDCVQIVEEYADIDVVAPWEVAEGEPDWYTNIVRICSRFRLFELATAAAGPDLTPRILPRRRREPR